MLDLATLQQVNREATQRAAERNREPVVIDRLDVEAFKAGNDRAIRIPYVGGRVPYHWRRVNIHEWFGDNPWSRGFEPNENDGYGAFFVDKSGFGRPGEPALTIEEFVELIRPGYGYAVVEEGQFQVMVGVFEHVA